MVKLKDLKPITYYVIVRKDGKDNAGGGEQTDQLEEKKINKVTIVSSSPNFTTSKTKRRSRFNIS